MALFGLIKKKEEFPAMSTFGQSATMQSANGLDRSLEMDSGLNLDALNNSNINQEQQQAQQYDSFGNPRPQRRFEDPYNSQSQGYAQNQQQSQSSGDTNRDLQLIIAKLDAIKAEVQNLGHRIENLERAQQQPAQKRYNW